MNDLVTSLEDKVLALTFKVLGLTFKVIEQEVGVCYQGQTILYLWEVDIPPKSRFYSSAVD